MAIAIEDVRTITLTGGDRFTATVRQGLTHKVLIVVDSLSYVRGSTGRLGRSVRLQGRLVGGETSQAHGFLWLSELPSEMAYALTDERPALDAKDYRYEPPTEPVWNWSREEMHQEVLERVDELRRQPGWLTPWIYFLGDKITPIPIDMIAKGYVSVTEHATGDPVFALTDSGREYRDRLRLTPKKETTDA